MSQLATTNIVRLSGATSKPSILGIQGTREDSAPLLEHVSESSNPTETASNSASKTAASRKRRFSQTGESVNSNLSMSTEAQGLSEMGIDDFGSGIVKYMSHWKAEIVTRKMTHLEIVRKYVVWNKTPLSLFQEINLQSLFIYMDAYHPGLACNSQDLHPSTDGSNLANLNSNSRNWHQPSVAPSPCEEKKVLETPPIFEGTPRFRDTDEPSRPGPQMTASVRPGSSSTIPEKSRVVAKQSRPRKARGPGHAKPGAIHGADVSSRASVHLSTRPLDQSMFTLYGGQEQPLESRRTQMTISSEASGLRHLPFQEKNLSVQAHRLPSTESRERVASVTQQQGAPPYNVNVDRPMDRRFKNTIPPRLENPAEVKWTPESYSKWINDSLIVKALLDPRFVAGTGSNLGSHNLNASNHTVPVDASNRAFIALNTSNPSMPLSNWGFQQFDRSNPSIPVGEYAAPQLRVPGWTTGPLIPNIRIPNSV